MRTFPKIHMLCIITAFVASIVFLAQPGLADGGVVFDDDGGFEVPADKNKKPVKFGDDKAGDKKSETKKADKTEAKKTDETKKSSSDDKKAEDKKAADEKEDSKKAEKEEFELVPGLTDKFASIAELGRVSEETQKKFLKIQIAREKALQKFDKKAEPTIARYEKKMAREDDDKKLQKKYQKKIDEINAQRTKLDFKHEVMALKLLSKEENARRNSAMLWNAVSPDVTMLNLSEQQLDQVRKICDEFGAKSRRPLLDQTVDKASEQVAKKLMKSVLNKVQQKEYRRFLRERVRDNKR